MSLSNHATDEAVLTELGKRLARHRLNHDYTQARLAVEAGISKATVVRIEAGKSTQLSSYVRVLRALGLLETLGSLVPEPLVSPMQQLRRSGRVPRRASSESKRARRRTSDEGRG